METIIHKVQIVVLQIFAIILSLRELYWMYFKKTHSVTFQLTTGLDIKIRFLKTVLIKFTCRFENNMSPEKVCVTYALHWTCQNYQQKYQVLLLYTSVKLTFLIYVKNTKLSSWERTPNNLFMLSNDIVITQLSDWLYPVITSKAAQQVRVMARPSLQW